MNLMPPPELVGQPKYRAAGSGSFLVTSVCFVGLAGEAWRRWRRPR